MHKLPLTVFISAGLILAMPVNTSAQSNGSQSDASAAEDDVTALVRRGRTKLDAGDAAEAQVLFEEAAAKADNSLATRMWVLRAWMEQGRSNDTLDALDAIRQAGETGPALDYLYGMAFVRRAQGLIAEAQANTGLPKNTIQMNFTSGYERLSSVLPRNERLFRDGWITLARAAWHEAGVRSDPEDARAVRAVARDAAERAVAFYPSHVDAHLMLGRVTLSQFVSDMPEGAEGPEQWGPAALHWNAAVRSFSVALELARPTKDNETHQMLAATAGIQLGNTLMWKSERARAAGAYGRAIAWAPWAVDFTTVYNLLFDAESEEPLKYVLSTLESGQANYVKHFGADTEGDATTLWWLGWAYLQQGGREAESAKAFAKVLTKWPAYVDAWYYLYVARYGNEDWEGAAEALAQGWRADGMTMLNLMKEGDVTQNVARVEYLKSVAFSAGELDQAIALAEVSAETQPTVAVLWNDVGYFLRLRAEQLRTAEAEVASTPSEGIQDPETAPVNTSAELFQDAWNAYARALVLEPENPQLINDGAVILQFGLEQDFELARAMYQKAQKLASDALASPDLNATLRESFGRALEDARRNEAELPPRDSKND